MVAEGAEVYIMVYSRGSRGIYHGSRGSTSTGNRGIMVGDRGSTAW